MLRNAFRSRPAPRRPEGYDRLRQAVSFFLLVDREETHALLVRKKETPGYTWSGQVGMVGGMIEESDGGDLEAAYREFEEELSLPRDSIELLGDLGWFPSTIADALLHVYVALWNGEGKPAPDRREIDFLFEVPFSRFSRIHTEKKYSGAKPYDPKGKGPFYPVDVGGRGELMVWGVTARAVHSLLELPPGEAE